MVSRNSRFSNETPSLYQSPGYNRPLKNVVAIIASSGGITRMDEHIGDLSNNPQQAAIIPVHRPGSEAIQVCLIRRKDSEKWGISKGYIDPGHSWKQAALEEAYEEAGLRSHFIGESIGTYDYRKRDATLMVIVFVMAALEELSAWPEMHLRERRWFSTEEAGVLLKDHPARSLLDRIVRVLL
jgi:ADP-ribose pyrophosphatase YjhB (NUDIX family)